MGTKQIESTEGLEAWRNATAGRVIVNKLSADGSSRRAELIGSGKIVQITPTDRKLNQELAATEALDVFLNGCLQPVRLLDGQSDEMTSHPNHLTDEEALALFSASSETFVDRLSLITNASAVERLLKLAEDTNTEASFYQHRLIQERLETVGQPTMSNIRGYAPARDGRPEVEVQGGEYVPKAVTPR